jgi:four helix bundle protein
MRDFRQLRVWKLAHNLTLKIYEVTATFPKEEQFSLTSQIRRSVSSIPTNIAEGCGRGGNKEYGYFLQIAVGSTYELDYQILLAKELHYIEDKVYKELQSELDGIQRQLVALMKKVKAAP